MAANLGTAYIEVLPRTDKLVPGVKNALGSESSGPLAREGKRGGGVLAGALGKGLKLAGGVAVGAAAATVGVAFTKGLDRYMKIEGAEKKLSALGNSAADVAKIMAGATASVKGTAFGLGDAADVAAAAVASGIKPGQQLEQTLKTIANTAAIAGVDMGSMGAIFNKVAAQGKLQGDELAQLGERGVPALQFLSKELGVTAGEVSEMASKGKIDFETFERAMRNGMSPDAAVQMGDTLSGTWDNLGASLGRLGAEVMERVGPPIKDAMSQATGAVDAATSAIGPALDTVGAVITDVKDSFIGLGEAGPSLDPVKDAFGRVQDAVAEAWRVAEPILQQVRDWLVVKWAEIQPKVEEIFGTVRNTVTEMMLGVEAIIRGVTQIVSFIWDRWGDNILAIVGALIDTVIAVVGGFAKVLEGAWTTLTGFLTGDTDKMKRGVSLIFEGLSGAVVGIVSGLVRVLGSVWDGIKGVFAGPVNWVIDHVINPLADAVNKVAETFGAKWRMPKLSRMATGGGRSGGGGKGSQIAMRDGGPVPGWSPSPTADNIPIWATAGEFMVRQKSVRKLQRNHRGLLDYMNATGHLPPGYEPQGYAGGGRIIPNARQGFANYYPPFLNAIRAWASATGRTWSMTGNGGARSFADQLRAWNLYKSGRGPLAANPYRGGPHMVPGRAMDLSPRPGQVPSARALLGRYGLGLTVRGEPWHVGWLAGGRGGPSTGPGEPGTFDPFGGILDRFRKKVPGGGMWGDILSAIPGKLIDMALGAQLFDSGGWLEPGLTLASNQTGRPERVLTDSQWDALDRDTISRADLEWAVDQLVRSLSLSIDGREVAHAVRAHDRRGR